MNDTRWGPVLTSVSAYSVFTRVRSSISGSGGGGAGSDTSGGTGSVLGSCGACGASPRRLPAIAPLPRGGPVTTAAATTD